MKHYFLILASICCLLLTFWSCSNDNDESVNPLSDTLWSYSYEYTDLIGEVHKRTEYLEFTDKQVSIWVNSEGKQTGTYTVNGNKIEFQDLSHTSHHYIDGQFTNTSLTVNYTIGGDKGQTTYTRHLK